MACLPAGISFARRFQAMIPREDRLAFDLLQIGQLLKEEREERAISLSDVSEALYVRKSVVAALESGRWELLPHHVYVKGYVKQYARYLGVDQDLLQQLFAGTLSC
jgi:cytoskeleton protein RodZ